VTARAAKACDGNQLTPSGDQIFRCFSDPVGAAAATPSIIAPQHAATASSPARERRAPSWTLSPTPAPSPRLRQCGQGSHERLGIGLAVDALVARD